MSKRISESNSPEYQKVFRTVLRVSLDIQENFNVHPLFEQMYSLYLWSNPLIGIMMVTKRSRGNNIFFSTNVREKFENLPNNIQQMLLSFLFHELIWQDLPWILSYRTEQLGGIERTKIVNESQPAHTT